jgi:hypothetical protein
MYALFSQETDFRAAKEDRTCQVWQRTRSLSRTPPVSVFPARCCSAREAWALPVCHTTTIDCRKSAANCVLRPLTFAAWGQVLEWRRIRLDYKRVLKSALS